jgi:hypothetical protein
MCSHEIHRGVVTHEQKAAGILSAFDLLQLVGGRWFVTENPPTPPMRQGARGG